MNLFRVVARDFCRVEIVKGAAKIIALAQYRDPRQPGLETIEDEFFIERAIVVFGNAPFGVVIGEIKRVFARPRTAYQAVGMQARRFAHATVCFAAFSTSSGSARL